MLVLSVLHEAQELDDKFLVGFLKVLLRKLVNFGFEFQCKGLFFKGSGEHDIEKGIEIGRLVISNPA